MAQRQRPSKQKTATSTSNAISLKGSTKTVVEFFEFGLASILYQRNLFPPDDFKMVKKYGLNMLMPQDESLQTYLRTITGQLSTWLNNKQVSRLVLAIISKETRETLERWQFEITLEDRVGATKGGEGDKENDDGSGLQEDEKDGKKEELSEKDVRMQIQQMIKHICASNAFLPILEESCTFNVLAYTSKDIEVPITWEDSDARMIKGGAVEQVKLRGFSTNVHRVDAMVAYRLGEDA